MLTKRQRRGRAESSIAAQMVRATWDEKGTLSSYDEQLAKDVSAALYLGTLLVLLSSCSLSV